MNYIKLAIKIGFFVLLAHSMQEGFAESLDLHALPPSATVKKINVTTGLVIGIKKMKSETELKIKSEADQKEWLVILKRDTHIYKNGRKQKKAIPLENGLRVRAYHTNFKGSFRQIVQKLEILDEHKE